MQKRPHIIIFFVFVGYYINITYVCIWLVQLLSKLYKFLFIYLLSYFVVVRITLLLLLLLICVQSALCTTWCCHWRTHNDHVNHTLIKIITHTFCILLFFLFDVLSSVIFFLLLLINIFLCTALIDYIRVCVIQSSSDKNCM